MVKKKLIAAIFFLYLALLGQALAAAEIMAAELMKQSLILCILPMRVFVILCLYIGMVFHLTLIMYILEHEDFLQWIVSRKY